MQLLNLNSLVASMCVCVLMGDVCEEYVQVYMCMSVIVTRVLLYKHVKVTVLMTVMTQFI